MTKSRFNRRLIPAIAALAVPMGVVLGGLVVAGGLQPLAAVVGLVISLGLTCVLLRPYGEDVALLTAFIRDLEKGEDVAAPEPRTVLVTDLAAALNQLRRAWRGKAEDYEARLGFHETLFDTLPSPLFLLNGQRRIVGANRAARSIFGRKLPGRDLAAVMRAPALLEAVEKVLSGEPGRDVEIALPLPQEMEFRAMLEPLPRPGVDGTAAILTLHDVTALRRLERMRADFVANASHELRTPLAALLGFIETLRGPARDDTEARERFLAIMYDQAGRMSRLVADLLNLSRIELNEHTRPIDSTDLAGVVGRVAEGLELQARERKMKIVLAFPAGLPEVVGDADQLAQIFQNLMDNAVKYGRDGTEVTVSARLVTDLPSAMAKHCERAVAVSVADKGDGIAREHLPRLTERFFRVDTARSRRMGGTGLGLAIVKHVVNRHRGLLAIDSTPGLGSVFTVYLPAAEEPTADL